MKAIARLAVLAVICLLTLTACADVKPFDYQAADEIPAGPGLFSGADGALVFPSGILALNGTC